MAKDSMLVCALLVCALFTVIIFFLNCIQRR